MEIVDHNIIWTGIGYRPIRSIGVVAIPTVAPNKIATIDNNLKSFSNQNAVVAILR